jgi:hypothetical protein
MRSCSVADASLFEHFSQGIRTVRLPTSNPSPSGVVSMAVAVIGSVACISLASKCIVPFSHDQIKVVKDDFAHFTPQSRRQIVRPGFLDFIKVRLQPILAFCLAFAGMNVNRFIAFVHVEEEPPPQNHQYRGHAINAPLTGFSRLAAGIYCNSLKMNPVDQV